MTDPTPPPQSSLVLTLDMEKYLSQLDGWENVPEEQKLVFIQTLWDILRNFAELGYEIHPAQLVQKLHDSQQNTSKMLGSVIHSTHPKQRNKHQSAGRLVASQSEKESPCNQPKH